MEHRATGDAKRRRLTALLSSRYSCSRQVTLTMIDVHVPTTDGRDLMLTRHTEPEPELRLLLDKLRLVLPAQPPPKITAQAPRPKAPV